MIHGILLFFLLFTSCATQEVTFKSQDKALVSVHSIGDRKADAKSLGETPQTIKGEELYGKIVQISAPGRKTQQIIFANPQSPTTEFSVDLEEDSSGNSQQCEASDSKDKINRMMRLVVNSYKAISGKRFQAANELADQAVLIDPEISMPLVVKGMALHMMGRRDEARTSLEKALSLDPQNTEIAALMSALNLR